MKEACPHLGGWCRLGYGKNSMTLKTFTRDFRRGLGSAILELKNNPEREKYHDSVMKFCLKDIAHDTQIEGTKGYYNTEICNSFKKNYA